MFCVKTAVDDFKHISSRFYTLFIDFRDAFGSIKHEYLIKSLLEAGIEEGYCEIFADIYEDAHIEVICGNALTKEFARTIGCKTGGPASQVLFIVGFDKHLRRAVIKAEIITKAENPKRISPLFAGGMQMMLHLCLSQFQLGISPRATPGISSKTLPGGRDLTCESCPGAGNSTRAGILWKFKVKHFVRVLVLPVINTGCPKNC